MDTVPVTGRSNPAIPRSRVDLPQPLGPSRLPICPGSSANVASVTTALPPKPSDRVSRLSIGSPCGVTARAYSALAWPREIVRLRITTGTTPTSTIIRDGTAASASRSSDASS